MTIPSAGSRARRPRSPLMWLIWLPLIMIGCDAVGMLFSLLMPAIGQMRDAPRREACLRNLKRIGLAMQAYHQTHGCFPPSFIADKNGKPQHSWRVLILPFLDEQALYAKYRFDEPWNSTHNMALADQMPSIYRCPSETTSGSNTNYAMLVGPHAFSNGSTSRRMSDGKDRLSNTIMVAEAAGEGINWLEPRDLDTTRMAFYLNSCTPSPRGDIYDDISSRHPGRANVLFVDGSVQTLSSASLDPKELEAMIIIHDNKAVPAGH